MDAITLLITFLATARITRFVTTDRLADGLRARIFRRLNPEGLTAYLLVCDWCVSIYVGAGVAGLWLVWGETVAFQGIALALSASYAAGFLNSKVDD